MAAGDFDDDGDDDLIWQNEVTPAFFADVFVSMGDGGSFPAATTLASYAAGDLLAWDEDGDDFDDLLIGHRTQPFLFVHRGGASGLGSGSGLADPAGGRPMSSAVVSDVRLLASITPGGLRLDPQGSAAVETATQAGDELERLQRASDGSLVWIGERDGMPAVGAVAVDANGVATLLGGPTPLAYGAYLTVDTGDLTGDGVQDYATLVTSFLSSLAGALVGPPPLSFLSLEYPHNPTSFGASRVGDVDGDAADDLIVIASTETASGVTFVFCNRR